MVSQTDAVTDELMRGVWTQVAILREHRIAHRDLRRANVFVQDDGVPWLIDFGFSEVAVADEILDADVAQMMASFAVVVGAERAVRAAVESIGSEAVGQALPRLQMAALSGATQTALKEHKGLLEDVQAQVIEQCNVENVEFTQLQRVSRKTVFTAVIIVLATYFLLPQFADLPGIVDQVKEANWAWTPLIILGSAMTYVAASIGLAGAIPQDLPTGPLFVSSVASSFASKLAPAGLGGMAMNIRFLQKQGVDEPEAVSGVGLNTIAGFVGSHHPDRRLHHLGRERCVRVVPAARPEVVRHRVGHCCGGPDRRDGDSRQPSDLLGSSAPHHHQGLRWCRALSCAVRARSSCWSADHRW